VKLKSGFQSNSGEFGPRSLSSRALRGFEHLEHFSLNPYSTTIQRSPLTLDILIPLATLCPLLCHLGLYLDTSSDSIHRLKPIRRFTPFPTLQTFNVGVTDLYGYGWQISIGAYIAHICPDIKHVQTHIPWRKQLRYKRSKLIPLDLNPSDRDHIRFMERYIYLNAARWNDTSKLVTHLQKASRPCKQPPQINPKFPFISY
jgi:hypothetical protein